MSQPTFTADPYATLGLSSDCNDDSTIKSAYRKLALQYHPDKLQLPANATEEEKEVIREQANERFAAVSNAYQQIQTVEKRQEYALQQQSGSGGSSSYQPSSHHHETPFQDPFTVFDQVFREFANIHQESTFGGTHSFMNQGFGGGLSSGFGMDPFAGMMGGGLMGGGLMGGAGNMMSNMMGGMMNNMMMGGGMMQQQSFSSSFGGNIGTSSFTSSSTSTTVQNGETVTTTTTTGSDGVTTTHRRIQRADGSMEESTTTTSSRTRPAALPSSVPQRQRQLPAPPTVVEIEDDDEEEEVKVINVAKQQKASSSSSEEKKDSSITKTESVTKQRTNDSATDGTTGLSSNQGKKRCIHDEQSTTSSALATKRHKESKT